MNELRDHRLPVVVSGLGHVAYPPGSTLDTADPRPFLRERKSRKYMAPQDCLAVAAAGHALSDAGLTNGQLGARAGVFMCVGYIAFEQADLDALYGGSLRDGAFSMDAFSTSGVGAVNPLLTFRCLPNLAAYHVSTNFDVQGAYLVTYPGPGQFYGAIDRALDALDSGEVEVALVGGVAHQRNVLVRHHFARVSHPIHEDALADGAGFLVLERQEQLARRGRKPRLHLLELDAAYDPPDPFDDGPTPSESLRGADHNALDALGALGAASLPVWLSAARHCNASPTLTHNLHSRDGFRATSTWEVA